MTQKNTSRMECLTIGDLLVRDSRLNREDFYQVIKTGSDKFIASNFFGTKSASVRPQAKAKRVYRNFKFEAEMLMADHFNGIENNFGFTKIVGGSKI